MYEYLVSRSHDNPTEAYNNQVVWAGVFLISGKVSGRTVNDSAAFKYTVGEYTYSSGSMIEDYRDEDGNQIVSFQVVRTKN